MYLNNDNVPGKFEQNYFLIKIDIEKKEKYKQNSNILIEMLSTGDNYYYEYELPNYMPINQFIYGSFNLEENNDKNGYEIKNKNENETIIIEFS